MLLHAAWRLQGFRPSVTPLGFISSLEQGSLSAHFNNVFCTDRVFVVLLPPLRLLLCYNFKTEAR
jgi:hypothetical protein